MIFPTLKGRSTGYINLNEYAKEWLKRNTCEHELTESPLLDPQICQAMVDECHIRLGVQYSYGGWLEDRSVLWKGSYLEEDNKYTHLGLDINAPEGTPVALDMPGQIVFIDNDHPLVGGWGNRVMIKLHFLPIVLIYGHLANIKYRIGRIIEAKDIFAEIGPSSSNGSWYTHVHVQAMTMAAYSNFLEKPLELDGYGKESDISKLARLFPDPMQFIEIR